MKYVDATDAAISKQRPELSGKWRNHGSGWENQRIAALQVWNSILVASFVRYYLVIYCCVVDKRYLISTITVIKQVYIA